MVPPSNYFRSLTQPVEDLQPPTQQVQHPPQPVLVMAPNVVPKPVAAPVEPIAPAPALEENGIFVLPDPPSESHERDQAAALDALNAATESINVVNESIGEHPPPRYDEAVLGLRKGNVVAAPILPPRRGNNTSNVNQQFQGQSPTASGGDGLSLAERYGLPVAEI